MRNTKHQKPNTNKPSNSNLQIVEWEETVDDGVMVLRDEPASKADARHPFDLEERTAVFGERIVRFSKCVPCSATNNRLIDQLVGAGTSIGANFCEANDCVSKKDFCYTVKRCIKEAKETRFFLRMIVASEPTLSKEARDLYREATELLRILASMWRK